MEHRQYHQKRVFAGIDPEGLDHAVDVAEQVTVSKHRTLGLAGRARGVQDRSHVIDRVQRNRRRCCVCCNQRGPRQVVVCGQLAADTDEVLHGSKSAAEPGHCGCEGLVIDQAAAARVIEDVLDLVGVQQQIDGDHGSAGLDDAGIGKGKNVGVHAIQSDPIARHDIHLGKARRDAVRYLVEFLKRGIAAGKAYGDGLRVAPRGIAECPGQGLCRGKYRAHLRLGFGFCFI